MGCSCFRGFSKMDRSMILIDPMFIIKAPKNCFGFVCSLEEFKIDVFKVVEIWVVSLVIGDLDLFVGVPKIPREISS